MGRKINSDDIIRLVYESYKRLLKEDENSSTQQGNENIGTEQKPLNNGSPVIFNTSFSRGYWWFNVIISDEETIKKLENFQTWMSQATGTSGIFTIFRDKDHTNNLYLNVRLKKPEEMYDENERPTQVAQYNFNLLRLFFKGIKDLTGITLDKSEVKNAMRSIHGIVTHQMDKDTMKNVDEMVHDKFFEICQTLDKEETLKLLRMLKVDGLVAGHQLSLLNKLKIIQQAVLYDQNGGNQVNTISYIATQLQWREMGRRVIDFSHPYFYVTRNAGRVDIDKAVDYLAGQGKMVAKKGDGSIGQQTRHAITAATNRDLGKQGGFSYNSPGYDIQATEPIPGYEDKFSTEPGLKNNLQGEYNDAALAIHNNLKTDDSDRGEELNKAFGISNSDLNDLYMATCKASGSKPLYANSDNMEEKITHINNIIDKMVDAKLSGSKKNDARIMNKARLEPLKPVARFMIQAMIGVPMDKAPIIQWTQEHRELTKILEPVVNDISMKILHQRNNAKVSLDEKLRRFSNMIVFEEKYNNILNQLFENVKR